MKKDLIVDKIILRLDEEAPTGRLILCTGKRRFTLEYIDTQIDDSPYSRELNIVEVEETQQEFPVSTDIETNAKNNPSNPL